MSSKRYTDEFKIEAARQVTDRGFKVTGRLCITTHSLYAWRREYNEVRPKKALGGLTPAAYAKQLK